MGENSVKGRLHYIGRHDMGKLRFSPRGVLLSGFWDISRSWVEKSKTRPTSARRKLKGEEQHNQQQHNEHQPRQGQEEQIFHPDGCLVSYSGNSDNWVKAHDSRIKPPEGQVQGGKPTQLFQTSGNTLLAVGQKLTTLTSSKLPTSLRFIRCLMK